MKKIFVLGAIFFIILLIFLNSFLASKKVEENLGQYYGDFPDQSELKKKQTKEVGQRFMLLPGIEKVGEGLYSAERLLSEANQGFSILYDDNKEVFYFAITKSPVAQYSVIAIDYFMNTLNLSTELVCELQIYVADMSGVAGADVSNIGVPICQ